MQRVAVVGNTGSGKTTLATELKQRLGCEHIELDALFWQANWVPVDAAIFRERVERAVSAPAWVTDGNYVNRVRDLIWGRADTLVWLDYPLAITLARLAKRTVKRIVTHEALWNGCRETWRGQLCSRDSLFVWAVQTHTRHRKQYTMLLASPEYAHLQVVHLRSPRETAAWMREIETVA